MTAGEQRPLLPRLALYDQVSGEVRITSLSGQALADKDYELWYIKGDSPAGSMGVLGGLLGVALGWGIGKVINIWTNIYMQQQNIPPETFWVVPLWLVGAALGFSVIVSLLAGMYPAARAAKLDPVQALRHD